RFSIVVGILRPAGAEHENAVAVLARQHAHVRRPTRPRVQQSAAQPRVDAGCGPNDEGTGRRGVAKRGQCRLRNNRRGGVLVHALRTQLLLDVGRHTGPLAAGNHVGDEGDEQRALIAALQTELAAEVAELAELSAAEAADAAAEAEVIALA